LNRAPCGNNSCTANETARTLQAAQYCRISAVIKDVCGNMSPPSSSQEPAMSAVRGKVVQQQNGNVYSCVFGRETAPRQADTGARSVVADIRSEVAEINTLIREIAGTNSSVSEQASVNSQMLLDAIGKLDSIAFQSNLLAHGLAHGLAGDGIELVADDVQTFVAEGSGVVRRLRSLVCEHKVRMVNLARSLKEIGEQVAALEVMTSTRVGPVRSGVPVAN